VKRRVATTSMTSLVGGALVVVAVAVTAVAAIHRQRVVPAERLTLSTSGVPGTVAESAAVPEAAVEVVAPTPSVQPPLAADPVRGESAFRIIHGLPWWHWIKTSDCIAEVTLAEAWPERSNTVDGLPPEGEALGDWGGQTYVALRFDVQNVIWCNQAVDGFVTLQRRRWFKERHPTLRLGEEYESDPWWVRPETLHAQPNGLAMVVFLPSGYHPPEDPDYQMWTFVVDVAASLSGPSATYRAVSFASWYEYVDGEALEPLFQRRLPISDLLVEVQAGLIEAGK
jgi:hypothetical protein